MRAVQRRSAPVAGAESDNSYEEMETTSPRWTDLRFQRRHRIVFGSDDHAIAAGGLGTIERAVGRFD